MTDKTSSTKLSEVICALVASVAHARKSADIEAVRIGQRYRESELLNGLPVPRLRFKQVNLSLPMILSELIPGKPAELSSLDTIVEAARQALMDGVKARTDALEAASKLESKPEEERRQAERGARLLRSLTPAHGPEPLALSGDAPVPETLFGRFEAEFRRRLDDALRDAHSAVPGGSPSDVALRAAVGAAADEIFTTAFHESIYEYIKDRVTAEKQDFDRDRALEGVREMHDEPFIADLKRLVRLAAERAAIKVATVDPDFAVTVGTDEIRNAGGGPDVVTRISMVIVEEGLEWVTEISEERGKVSKLIPE
jgi:hypothetical protein